jgi:hypothetical protein
VVSVTKVVRSSGETVSPNWPSDWQIPQCANRISNENASQTLDSIESSIVTEQETGKLYEVPRERGMIAQAELNDLIREP